MSEETIHVSSCPYCKGAHTYRLEVERARVLMMPSNQKKREPETTVKITSQIFCPLNDEQYQVSYYLQDTSSDRIRAVSVIGLVGEEPQ